jgi:hypothetical protein
MDRFRRLLLASGLAGLLLAGLLVAVCVWLVAGGILHPLLPQPLIAAFLAVVFGGLSLAEIPMMVFAIRHLAVERQAADGLVLGLNALFVSFAAVYAAPVLLLSGSLGWGLALAALSPLRLAASLLFVRIPRSLAGSRPDEGEGEQP